MQGKKEYQEKLFLSFRLSERVPKDNFYRRLKEVVDLSYLRNLTKRYYGTEGLCLVSIAFYRHSISLIALSLGGYAPPVKVIACENNFNT